MTNRNETPNCDMHEALVSYLYNEASPEESRSLREHMVECASCKQELIAFERVRDVLQQWQVDEAPAISVITAQPRPSRLGLLKELFSVTPLWAKAVCAMAMAMLVLAITGTEIKIGRDGFSIRADLLGSRRNLQATPAGEGAAAANLNGANQSAAVDVEKARADIKMIVAAMIAESEQRQKENLKAQLVSFESQLQNMRSSDLAKLATRLQEHQSRIKTIERDIDRREGLDLTDILFSEVTRDRSGRAAREQGGGD